MALHTLSCCTNVCPMYSMGATSASSAAVIGTHSRLLAPAAGFCTDNSKWRYTRDKSLQRLSLNIRNMYGDSCVTVLNGSTSRKNERHTETLVGGTENTPSALLNANPLCSLIFFGQLISFSKCRVRQRGFSFSLSCCFLPLFYL